MTCLLSSGQSKKRKNIRSAVSENPYSYQEEGYAKLYLTSGGADSPRPVQMRLAKDGKWYLWEQFLFADIRQPSAADPWA